MAGSAPGSTCSGLIFVVASVNVGIYLLFRDLVLAGVFWHRRVGLGLRGAGDRRLADHVQPGRCSITTAFETTTAITDFSGYLILVVAVLLTLTFLAWGATFDFSRLTQFVNNTGEAGGAFYRRAAHRAGGLPGRPALPGLHDHRLRRLGAHVRGDDRRPAQGAARHPALDLLVARLRPDHGDLLRPGDPGPGGRRQGRRQLLVQPVQQPAGAEAAQGPARDRHRGRQLLLRARRPDLDLAHGVRLRPRRRPARLAHPAPGQPGPSHAGARDLDLRRAVGRGDALLAGLRRPGGRLRHVPLRVLRLPDRRRHRRARARPGPSSARSAWASCRSRSPCSS